MAGWQCKFALVSVIVDKLKQEADTENQFLRQALLDARADKLAQQVLELREEVQKLQDTVHDKQ